MEQELNFLDYSVVAMYFVILIAIVLYITIVERKADKSSKGELAAYFLGGKNLSWAVVGASLFASNIGTEHLVGLAGAGAAGDFAATQFELLAAFSLMLLGWLFVPFYLKSGVFTMPEFLERRYSAWSRSYLSYISIAGYVLTKISVTIAAGGIIFTTLLGIDFWTGSIIVVVITGLYTIFGGLKAVVYTDFMQLIVLFLGSIALTYFALNELGGWSELKALTTDSHLSLWRPMNDPDFPWTGIVLGAPILGVWYWCTDQFIVQRVLAARDLNNARQGTIFASFLKILPLFIFVLPGVLAFALVSAPGSDFNFPLIDGEPAYDAALPILTMSLLPAGLRGLVVSGLIAALMSSLSSVFNSCSTLITLDIYKKWNPAASEGSLVRVGQGSTLILIGLGLAWIPFMQLIEGGLFQKLQSIQAYISPPVAALFLIGVFSRKVNERGAKLALIVGLIIGVLRLILELNKGQLSGAPLYFAEINFLHFAFILFLICSAVLWFGSLSAKVEAKNLDDITMSPGILKLNGQGTNMLLSALVVICIFILWIVFA